MRYASIDLLRTLAIFLMVVVHFLENLSGVDWAPAGFGAPMFGFLVGVSYWIWQNAQIRKGKTEEEISWSTLRRGLALMVAGIIFNIAVWLPSDMFNWDVLTLIGSAFLLLWMVRDLPPIVPVLICFLVYVVSPILRIHAGYDEYWENGYFDPDWSLSQIVLGYLVNGYFPIFPWVIFPLIGYLAGKSVLPDLAEPDPTTGPLWNRVLPVAWVGLAFLALGFGLYLTRSYQTDPVTSQVLRGWTMFPASMEYVTTVIGGVLLAFSFALWWIDDQQGLEGFPGVHSFSRTMSQHSLSIYVFHHILHIWPLWLCGVLAGYEATHYWRKALPWQASLALVVPGIVVTYLLFRWVERTKSISLESVLRSLAE